MPCSRKHVVVTGADSEIAQATIEACIEADFHVIAGHQHTIRPAGDISTSNPTSLQLDITEPEHIDELSDLLNEHCGSSGLDALVNLAGLAIAEPLEVLDIKRLRLSHEVNTIGQLAVTQPLIPLLREAKGRVVFMGSSADRSVMPFAGALTSSHSALLSLVETLRLELEPWQLPVILVEPMKLHEDAVQQLEERVARTMAGWSPAERRLYGETFEESMLHFLSEQKQGSRATTVAETVLLALTSRRPKGHYISAPGSNMLAALADLPAGLQDKAKRNLFRLPKPRTRDVEELD